MQISGYRLAEPKRPRESAGWTVTRKSK